MNTTTPLMLLAMLLTACGGTEAPAEPPAEKEAPAEAEAPAEKEAPAEAPAEEEAPNIVTYEDGVAVVALEGTDQMKFNTSRIEVKTGSKVKLTLTHTGQLPANSMGHNFVLLAQGTDLAAFAGAATKAGLDANHIPADMSSAVIANTKVIGGGETVTIEFDAPAAGEYDFICSFPGHYALMQGKFVVAEGGEGEGEGEAGGAEAGGEEAAAE